MTTRKSTKNDGAIKIQDMAMDVDEFTRWIVRGSKDVTAPMLAKVEVDIHTKRVVLGVVTGGGFDIKTKQQLDVPFQYANFIEALVKTPGEFYFFMGTMGLYDQTFGERFIVQDLAKLVQGLALIKGKDDIEVPDIYLATPQIKEQLVQFVQLPTGEIINLSAPNRRGIINVRFVGGIHNILIGTIVDERGIAQAIRMLPINRILSEAISVKDINNWNNTIHPPDGRKILRIGRPQIVNDQYGMPIIRMAVYFQGYDNTYYQRVLTLTLSSRRYIADWGQEYIVQGTRIPIGMIAGYDDLFVSTTPDIRMAHVYFETRAESPMAQAYLRVGI